MTTPTGPSGDPHFEAPPRYEQPYGERSAPPGPEYGGRGPSAPPPTGFPAPPQQPTAYRHYQDSQGTFVDEAARFNRRHLRTPETKEFFKTSEFALTVVALITLMVAAAIQSNFDAPQMWRYFTAIVVAYIVSRGIAKAGAHRSEPTSGDR